MKMESRNERLSLECGISARGGTPLSLSLALSLSRTRHRGFRLGYYEPGRGNVEDLTLQLCRAQHPLFDVFNLQDSRVEREDRAGREKDGCDCCLDVTRTNGGRVRKRRREGQ